MNRTTNSCIDPAIWTDTAHSENPGRECSVGETELMRAMQEYKQQSGRPFPTWGEVLEILKGLGDGNTTG